MIRKSGNHFCSEIMPRPVDLARLAKRRQNQGLWGGAGFA
jgi:hypothetical protein